MSMHPRDPSPAERRRRLRRLGAARRTAPIVRAMGRRWVRKWVDRRLWVPDDGQLDFQLPLPFAEAAWGTLPVRSVAVTGVSTILADWVDCEGRLINTTDYFVGGGDWRPLLRSTDGDPVREEARQLKEANLRYRETEAYSSLLAQLDARVEAPRRQGRTLHAVDDVDAYFERFVRLFRSVATHGVLPEHELEVRGLRFNNDRPPGVAIASDGTVHRLQGGNHRWAIAQVLGIPEVPAEVRLVHVEAIGRFWEVPNDPLRELSGTP